MVEDVGLNLRRNSGSVINDFWYSFPNLEKYKGKLSLLCDCINSIVDEVSPNLQVTAIDTNGGQGAIVLPNHFNARFQPMIEGSLNSFMDIYFLQGGLIEIGIILCSLY